MTRTCQSVSGFKEPWERNEESSEVPVVFLKKPVNLKLRLLALIGTSFVMAGCSGMGSMLEGDEAAIDDDQRDFTAAQAANPPHFQTGDRFRFDNQDMTWQVTNVSEQSIQWQSDTGEQQITTANPLLPAIEWNSRSRGKGKRLISNMKGAFFPLRTGNEVHFKTTVNTDKPPYAWEFDWKCMIAGEEQVQIAMGVFDTFRVECSRQEPEKWIFYYAPRIGYYVKMEATGLKNGATSSRTLKGFVKNAVAYGDIEPAMAEAIPVMSEPAKVTSETMPEMDKSEEEMAMQPAKPANMAEGTKPITGEAMMEKQPDETAMKPVTGETEPKMEQAPSAGFMLHLASYKQQANLERGQQDLLKKFPTQLSGMSFSSKQVDLGSKGIYYRLFAGPTSSRASANSLCKQLKARGQYCVVSKSP